MSPVDESNGVWFQSNFLIELPCPTPSSGPPMQRQSYWYSAPGLRFVHPVQSRWRSIEDWRSGHDGCRCLPPDGGCPLGHTDARQYRARRGGGEHARSHEIPAVHEIAGRKPVHRSRDPARLGITPNGPARSCSDNPSSPKPARAAAYPVLQAAANRPLWRGSRSDSGNRLRSRLATQFAP